MTARALRLGVVLGGNLVEERLFADAGPITIGQSLRCRLSVPVDGVPAEHTLFVRDQGRLLLVLTDRMTGRVAQGGEMQSELKGTIAIERGARGKLQIGEATILFQEVPVPARQPRPQLPASVRGTFADRIDKRLALIVGGSLLVHISLGAWAWMTDVEHPTMGEPRAFAEYRQDTYSIEMPDEIEPATTQEPSAATPALPKQTPAPIVRNPTRITTTQGEPKMTTDEAERFAQMLTTDSETPGGRTGMNARQPGAELDKQIKDIRDNGFKIGKDDGGFRNRPDGINPTDHQITRDTGPLVQEQPREEETKPRIDLRPPPKRPPGDDPSPDGIIGKIRTDYMPGLMRCYQMGLRVEPSLRGTVAVTFTVLESGKIEDPSARGVSKEVDSCIANQMASWRFAVPRNAKGESSDLDIKLSLALAAGS